jgi:hypothetical protein
MKTLFSLWAVFPVLAQTQTGAVHGIVMSDDGQPIMNATVLYTRIPVLQPRPFGQGPYDLAPGETIVNNSTETDGTGHFDVGGLPTGSYLICAEASGQALLNPCKWSGSYSVTIAAGAREALSIVMKRGVLLKVHIDDPQGLLLIGAASPLDFPHLIVGVIFGEGGFLAAETANVIAGGRDFQMPIPAGVPLRLWLQSGHVTLADANSAPVDHHGARIPFQAAPGMDETFQFRVTGAASE